jgi:hypothetical protein
MAVGDSSRIALIVLLWGHWTSRTAPVVAYREGNGSAPVARSSSSVCLKGRIAPSVLILGAQKAGTSALAADLRLNVPGLTDATALRWEPKFYTKELHFFTDESRYSRGMGFYTSHFPRCGEARYGIDATPVYLRRPETAARVHSSYPASVWSSLRYIVLLRNPSDRLRSWYDHLGRMWHHIKMPFDDWVRGGLAALAACGAHVGISLDSDSLWDSRCRDAGSPFYDVLTGGMYAPQIAKWLDYFAASQIAVTFTNGLSYEPDKVLNDLSVFITGTQPHRYQNGTHAPGQGNTAESHGVAKSAFSTELRAELDSFFRPHIDSLVNLLNSPRASAVLITPDRRPLTASVLGV